MTGDTTVKGRGRCPKCGSRKVDQIAQHITDFYANQIEVCGNCGTAWEPMPEGGNHLDDDGTPFPFPEPCNNCAFRAGSPEQQDAETWRDMIASLKSGGAKFYCHKGVPLSPNSKDGFDYPKRRNKAASEMIGAPVDLNDMKRLRLCRGYLNMIAAQWRKEFGGNDRKIDDQHTEGMKP